MRARHIRFTAAAAAAALLQAAPLQGATINWGDATGFWDVPGNWVGGILPGAADDVVINVGGMPTVTYQTITSTIRSLAITNATFSVASGTLDVTNTYTSNSATNISGGGLNLNGASSLATLSLTGGTLGGTGAVTISGLATWTNGTMTGPGVTNANGGMALGEGNKFLDGGRVLNVAGTTTWSGATSDFTNRLLLGGGTINNNGTWLDQNTFTNDIANNGGTNAFNNLGTYTKSGAATTSVSVAFNNTGTVNVNAGTLGLSGGGTSSGTFNVGASSTLDFSGGTHAFSTTTSIIGGTATSNVVFSGGTNDFNGTYNVAGTTTVAGGTLDFNAASTVNSVGALSIAAGIVNFSSGNLITPTAFSISSGTLAGSDTVTLANSFTWTHGTMTGPGVTNANGGMALGEGNKFLDGGRVLNVAGTTTWSGATSDFTNRLLLGGGTINNNGTWLDQNTFTNDIANNGGTNAFNNLGTYTKSGAATTSVSVAFNNTGTVNVNAGTLGLSGGGTSSGTFNVGASSTLDFSGGTHAFSTTTSIIGGTATSNVVFSGGTNDFNGTYNVAGTTTVAGGTLDFNAASTVNSVGALSIAAGIVNFSSGNLITPTAFSISSGTLAGSDTVTLANSFTWTHGTMTGPGVTNANGGMALGEGNKFLDGGRVLNVAGTTTWSGATSDFTNRLLLGGGTINNNGTWLDQNTFTNDIANNGGTNAFNNLGTYTKSGAATTSVSVAFNNTGTVNVNAGTMDFTSLQGTGTLQIGAAGTALLGTSNTTTGTLLHNGTAANSLVLGANTVTVSSDYNNANFGVGNAFNRRANVSATGVGNQILASGDVNQAITAGPGTTVNNGATTAPSIVVGNVRVGSTTYTYNIANTGTSGPALRGAIQDAANGGNITDARLSGNGVLSSNWGPVGPGGSTARDITVTINTAGVYTPISGQTVSIINNFENTRSQLLTISSSVGAAAFNAAAGNATPTPVVLANQRIGGTASQTLTVANTAPAGSFSEDLNASFGTSTGNAAGTGSISGRLAGTNNTGAGSMTVGVDSSVAGVRSGTVTLNYQTAGAVNGVSNGLGLAAVGNQTINVSGNVYQVAQGQLNTAPLNFGTVQVGQAVSQALSISNIATGPNGFVEDLNASFGASNGQGASQILGAGSIAGLLAGNTNSSNMVVSVNTAIAGTINGSILVNFFTAGAVNGVGNGLGVTAVGSAGYGVQGVIQSVGQVVDQAVPVINTPTIALGNVRVGGAVATQFVSVTNQATGNAQAALNASISTASGPPLTASGSFNLLDPGATNASSLQVSMGNTSAAGSRSGTATVAFVSDANNIGNCAPNCQVNLPSQNVNITGGVFQIAQPTAVAPNPVALANQRVGGTLSTQLSITNTNAAPNGFQEGLDASMGATTGTAVTTGSVAIVNLGQGATDSTSLRIGVDTSTAGAKTGTAAVNLASNGTISGLTNLALTGQSVTVSGNVYQVAQGQLNTAPLNFGTVQVGQAVSQALSISNIATGPNGFVEDLNASFGASNGQGASQILGAGSIAGLLAGNTNSSNMVVSVNTAIAGTINGSILVNFFTAGAVNGVGNGLGVTAVGSAGYGVQGVIQSVGQVVDQAVPVINTPTIALGNVRVGGAVATQFVSVTNQATGNAQAALNASISTASGPPLTASGSFNLLDPGATNASSLQVSMGNTSAAGSRSGTATVAFVSDANNIGNCAPNCQVNLPSQNVNITGGVFQIAQPNFASTTVNVAAARVGGASQQALSVTNTNVAPGFQEGLTASIGSPTAGITASGAFTNLAAGAANSSSLLVGLDTATAGAKSGAATVNLVSTGAGTSGLADLGIGTQTINVSGNVYAPAVAQLNTVAIDFGIVRVGDAVAGREVSVTNAALVQSLNDTLQASFGSVSSPFSGSGVASNIGAGDTNVLGSLLVGLDTANAGVFNGSAAIDFASQNAEMADLALASQLVTLTGQVNNLANPAYALTSGIGSLTVVGTQYVLDLGTLVLGTEVDDELRLTNSIFGPADFLRGSWSFADPIDFGFSGWNAFADLGAGASIFDLDISFDALALGSFEDLVSFSGFSYNASDPNGIQLGRSLIVRATVIEGGGTVPEPGSLALLIAAGLIMLLLRYSVLARGRGFRC